MTIVWLIVSLQLLNVSFDPADPFLGTEDLSVNEIESCVELVLEIIMGQEDAVKESDESDEASGKPGTTVTLFSVFRTTLYLESPTIDIKNHQSTFTSTDIESLSLPILSPPPKLL